MNHILFLLTAAFCFPSITVAKIIEAGSPDKKNVITIETDNQVSYSYPGMEQRFLILARSHLQSETTLGEQTNVER